MFLCQVQFRLTAHYVQFPLIFIWNLPSRRDSEVYIDSETACEWLTLPVPISADTFADAALNLMEEIQLQSNRHEVQSGVKIVNEFI